ncbi:hypothetical protein E6O75_ATG09808 [Venturia nashicola]|uniref:Altered inheritance of mitochondria protein 11 n=1 Tax=Venturia nashicola TaxID=86259 RepID=A0A4Z1NZL3_9PEZI|nr:hypothetical protein E6O75_ATG09808 [Venturia nashicola]
MASNTTTDASSPPIPAPADSTFTSDRSRRQLKLWAGGAAFMFLSAYITRRAIDRRYRAIRPKFFHYSHDPPPIHFNGPLEALEALSISTINVFSFGMMMVGGTCWAFDIASVQELRERTRKRLGYEEVIEMERRQGGSVMEAEWIHNTLTKEEEERRRKEEPSVALPTPVKDEVLKTLERKPRKWGREGPE